MPLRAAAILLLLSSALMVGCAPSSQSLLGRDEASVSSVLGRPVGRQRHTMPTPDEQYKTFGPLPGGMRPGELYLSLGYSAWGEMWCVFLASPAIFERIHHRKPETKQECVIDVQRYPRTTIF